MPPAIVNRLRIQNEYEIYEEWRWRYAPEVTHNTEHVFGLLVPEPVPVSVAAREHLNFVWLPWRGSGGKGFFPEQCGGDTERWPDLGEKVQKLMSVGNLDVWRYRWHLICRSIFSIIV